MSEVKNCETCAHGKFDKLWGEYKCSKLRYRIYNMRKKINCALWEKREEVVSKKEDGDEGIDT